MSNYFDIVVLVHAAATWFMTGLIWFVQAVHYPLFATVADQSFGEYERRHQRLTTFVVGPAMLIELAAASLLVVLDGRWLTWAGLGLLGLIWISTMAIQVSLHQRLANGFDSGSHRMLVRSNWLRTIGWTLRALIAVGLIDRAVGST